MSGLKSFVWLSTRRGLGARKAGDLLARFGTPEAVYSAPPEEYDEIPSLTRIDKAELKNKSTDVADTVMKACEDKQIQLVTIQDAGYPNRLKNIDAPPVLLYVRGTLPVIDDEVCIAMVGTRRCTAYGISVAGRFGEEISAGGGIIVSGMAKGVDSAGHKGALNAGAPTVAVLGCGVDVCYPPGNTDLMNKIISNGAVISEYPPGVEAFAGNFPPRNRIISGLSLGVVVIEAPVSSGALITANHAADQGRDVFCVPGNIDSPSNAGVNNLIKEGAKAVTCGEDVLSEYLHMFPHKINIKNIGAAKIWRSPGARKSTNSVLAERLNRYSGDDRKILEAMTGGAAHIDDIILSSGLVSSAVAAKLTFFEIENVVVQKPGKNYELGKNF